MVFGTFDCLEVLIISFSADDLTWLIKLWLENAMNPYDKLLLMVVYSNYVTFILVDSKFSEFSINANNKLQYPFFKIDFFFYCQNRSLK